MKCLNMKQSNALTGKATILAVSILFFCCAPQQKQEKQETPIPAREESIPAKSSSTRSVREPDYTVFVDTASLEAYYALPHIKEWYPERILPPPFNFDVDLTDKTVVELWLIRNEIFARNGHLFEDAVLRGHFNQYDWYQPVFDVPGFKVKLTDREQAFVDRVLKLEEELGEKRYTSEGQYEMVHMDHVYNTHQFKAIDTALKGHLAENNFAIVPAAHYQLFHIYDYNHYDYIPNFITTDLYLQVLHKHFSTTLQKIEEAKFIPLLTDLLEGLTRQSRLFEQSATDETLKRAARWSTAYLAIASHLITGQAQVAPGMDQVVREETAKILASEGNNSPFLEDSLFMYAQFKPRANYTKSEALQRYFRCMKWLNTAPIHIDDDERFLSAALIAAFIKKSPENAESFSRFNKAITFIAGEEDNMSLTNLVALLSQNHVNDPSQLLQPGVLEDLRNQLKAAKKDRITAKGSVQVKPAVLFTAGRYSFDGEIMSRLIEVEQPEPKRPFPKGLDVFAAMGNAEAERILLTEYREADQWDAYPDSLQEMKRFVSSYSGWSDNMYSMTMDAIKTISHKDEHSPLFMQTAAWDRKTLVTSLAAWTQLKHDMLLYAEQPYAAQTGQGGGPPPPLHLSYVEPNVKFWEQAIRLINDHEATLGALDLLTDHVKNINESLREMATKFLTISQKQLSGEPVTRQEFIYLSWTGGRIEYLTYHILQSNHLPELEKDVALVADVYNYNGLFLEEAVGPVDEIYVIAEINGKPYLTRGAVFSYYEFTSPQPLSDEEWRVRVRSTKVERPIWVKDIMANTKPLESRKEYSF